MHPPGSAEDLPIPAVSARVVLRIAIAVDGRGLGAKLLCAEHPKNDYPTHHKKHLDVTHSVIPHWSRFKFFRLKRAFNISNYLGALDAKTFGDTRFGTKRTCPPRLEMAAFEGKADIERPCRLLTQSGHGEELGCSKKARGET